MWRRPGTATTSSPQHPRDQRISHPRAVDGRKWERIFAPRTTSHIGPGCSVKGVTLWTANGDRASIDREEHQGFALTAHPL